MGERGKQPRQPCRPGWACFYCDRPECDYPVLPQTAEEKEITAAGFIGYYEEQPHRTPEEQEEHHRQSSIELMKTLRVRRRMEGLCVTCGKRPPEEGKQQCRECLDKHKKYKYPKRRYRSKNYAAEKERREKRKKAGLCVTCGKRPPEEGKQQCRECLDKQAKQRADRKAKLKQLPTNI